MNPKDIIEFRRTFQALEKGMGSQVVHCCPGLSMAQCQALLAIEELGKTTVGQLAGRLDLDASTVSRTVEGLARRGVVTRRRGSRDRRVAVIQLSEAGRAKCRSINEASDAYYGQVLGLIPPDELESVMRRFAQLVRAFTEQETLRRRACECCSGDEK